MSLSFRRVRVEISVVTLLYISGSGLFPVHIHQVVTGVADDAERIVGEVAVGTAVQTDLDILLGDVRASDAATGPDFEDGDLCGVLDGGDGVDGPLRIAERFRIHIGQRFVVDVRDHPHFVAVRELHVLEHRVGEVLLRHG